MRKSVEVVIHDSEDDYRQEYMTNFVNGETLSLRGIPILFDDKSFDHIFFEPLSELSKKGRFSKRRAKKMNFIKPILNEEVDIEVMHEPDSGSIAVFCVDLDCVMYLRVRPGTGKMQIGSFFDFGRDHTKMYEKQKRKCVPITDDKLKELIN
ncbi:MAG: hypothetical protein WC490_04420 [Candidatus Margulisiibacteriota bacterium]